MKVISDFCEIILLFIGQTQFHMVKGIINAFDHMQFCLVIDLTVSGNWAVTWPSTPGRVGQLVGHLTRKSGVLGSIPGLATYFRFSFCIFKKGSCQLLAKVCARSTG